MSTVASPRLASLAPPTGARAVWALLRPHQWAKNALIVAPAALAHRLGEPETLAAVGVAFVAMSLCASGTYVVNDWLDRERDRAHPTKRTRPLAAGTVPPGVALGLAAVLVGAAFALAVAALPLGFAAVLAAYTATTLAYSLRLKAVELVDVLVLAALYALRVLAGGEAASVPLSEWLLGFSLFFFLALALLKRYAELRLVETGEAPADNGRGYEPGDTALVLAAGTACGLLAVLVFSLYTATADVQELYGTPARLWLVTPPLLYWTLRMWLLAHRGQMPDDPVLFAVKDPASYAAAAAVVGVLALAL